MTLLERIDNLISLKDLSRHKVEKLADISVGTINKWDKSIPRADKLKAVADVLDVTVDYLLTGENPPTEDTKKNETEFDFSQKNETIFSDSSDNYLESLITCYLLLSDQGKKCLANIAANLKEAAELYIKDPKGGKRREY